MKRLPSKSTPRRILRVFLVVIFGHPQVLVTVPLGVGLLVHAVLTLIRGEASHGFSIHELMKCVGFICALVLFAAGAIFHLVLTVAGSWERPGAATAGLRRSTIHGHKLECIVTRSFLLRQVERLTHTHRMIGPVAHIEPGCTPDVRYLYESITNVSELPLDFTYCERAPTAISISPTQGSHEADTAGASAPDPPKPTALIGVHPCDIHAIRRLDDVIRRPPRRTAALIVGIDCSRPCADGVICRDIETNHAEADFDVMLYPLAPAISESVAGGDGEDASPGTATNKTERFGVVFGSDIGAEWLQSGRNRKNGDIGLPDADELQRFDEYFQAKNRAFPRLLGYGKGASGVEMRQSFDKVLWQATAQRCRSCEECNQACPTSYNFDIQAGTEQSGAWIETRTGFTGCVGCGRCDRACAKHTSIESALSRFAEEARNATG